MDLRSSDIVVLGAFNPAIISPDWLFAQGIANRPSDPTSMDLQVHFGLGSGQEFVFTVDDCQWKVSPGRLVLEPKSPVNPGGPATRVLQLLPHTPVRALGMNFHFHGQPSDWGGGLPTLNERSPQDVGVAGSVLYRTWGTCVRLNDGPQLNISLRVTDSLVSVDFNFHREAPDIDTVIAGLESFESDRERAREILDALSKRRRHE